VTITKSITLDGTEGSGFGSILAAGTTGIIINAGANDVVTIRNVSINGGTIGIAGIRILSAKAVYVERCEIFGFLTNSGGDAGRGIRDQRASGSLVVTDTTIRNNVQSGILVLPASGATAVTADIDNCWIQGHGNAGVVASSGASVSISNSIITGNAQFGIFVEQPAGTTVCDIQNCVIAHNGVGVSVRTNTPLARISGTSIVDNGTGIQVLSGTAASFGNNRITGNGSGNAPTPGAGIALQ
jgi:nitrous oxidase accessory protein NosD